MVFSYPHSVVSFILPLNLSSSHTLLFPNLHKELHLLCFLVCEFIAVHDIHVMCRQLADQLFLVIFFTRCASNWSLGSWQTLKIGFCLQRINDSGPLMLLPLNLHMCICLHAKICCMNILPMLMQLHVFSMLIFVTK